MKNFFFILALLTIIGCGAKPPYKVDIHVTNTVYINTFYDITPEAFDKGALSYSRDTITLHDYDDAKEICKLKESIDNLHFTNEETYSLDTRGKIIFYYPEDIQIMYFDSFYMYRKKDNYYFELSKEFKKIIDDICYKRNRRKPFTI